MDIRKYVKNIILVEMDSVSNELEKFKLFLKEIENYQSNHYGYYDRNHILNAYNSLSPELKREISPRSTKKLFRGADGIDDITPAISFTHSESLASFFGTFVFPFSIIKEYSGAIDLKKVVKKMNKLKLDYDIGDDEGEVIVFNPKFKNIDEEKFRHYS